MAGAAGRAKRTRAVGAGVSLALHAAVLSWLGLHAAPALRTAPPEEAAPLTVELVRPPPLARTAAAAAVTRTAPPPVPPPEAVVVPRPRPTAPVPRGLPPKTLPLPPVPSAGTPRGAAAGPPSGAGGGSGPIGERSAPGPLPGQEMQGDLRGFLRGTVGCSHEEYLRLTPAERARCDAGFAAARNAPPIPPPDDRLAEFARGREANERKRARREGPLYQPVTACSPGSAGSNFGLGCLAPDAVHSVGKF